MQIYGNSIEYEVMLAMEYAVLEGNQIIGIYDGEIKEIPEGAVFFNEEDFAEYLELLRG